MRKLILLIAVFAVAGFSADVTGTWKGSLNMQGNAMEHTFVLKVDGDTVTGTLTLEGQGDLPIEEGTLDGDKISMATNMQFGKVVFSGTVTSDEMKLSINVGDGGGGPPGGGGPGGPMELTLKKVE